MLSLRTRQVDSGVRKSTDSAPQYYLELTFADKADCTCSKKCGESSTIVVQRPGNMRSRSCSSILRKPTVASAIEAGSCMKPGLGVLQKRQKRCKEACTQMSRKL